MGLIEVSERTSPQRAAEIKARLYGNPRASEMGSEAKIVHVHFQPPEVKAPPKRVIYQFIAPVRQDQNAHVFDWYKAECRRLGKRISDLEFVLGIHADDVDSRVYIHDIIVKMCHNYGVSTIDIRSDRRTRDIVLPRQKIMWVAKQITPCSYPEIGRHFGGRDHTTVLHAVRKIDALIAANDPSVADLKGWVSE